LVNRGEAEAFIALNNRQPIDVKCNIGNGQPLTWPLFTTIHWNVSQDDSASLGITGRHIYLLVDLKVGDDLLKI
jgi:hypothetical protein